MENSSLGTTQSLIRSHQQHVLSTKKFGEERKNSNQKQLFPLGCVSWASLTPPPSPQCSLPGDPNHVTPGWRRGRQDGWEALSLHREWDEAGPWGGGPGLGGWGAAAGRGKVSHCSLQPHCPSHTLSGWDTGGRGSLQAPQSLPGQLHATREGRTRHFCCCPCRCLAWRALSCKCDAATAPPEAPAVRGCGGARLKAGGTTGQQQQQHQGCPPPTPPRQPDPSPRAARSKQCPCGTEGRRAPWQRLIVVMAQVAVPQSAGPSEARPGVPRQQGTAQQSRPLSFSPRQPRRGVLAPHGAGPPR